MPENYTLLTAVNSAEEATLIRVKLEREGIDVFMDSSDSDDVANRVDLTSVQNTIYVHSRDVHRAETVLALAREHGADDNSNNVIIPNAKKNLLYGRVVLFATSVFWFLLAIVSIRLNRTDILDVLLSLGVLFLVVLLYTCLPKHTKKR